MCLAKRLGLYVLALTVLCEGFTVKPAGDPVVVWAAVDTYHKCHIIDVPDIPARAFVDKNEQTHMIEGSTNFHIMLGSSVLNQTRSCNISWNETGNPNPAMFAGDEFLDSVIAFDNGTVFVLMHTEYPGNVYHNCSGPAYPHCWTVSIGAGISHDWGLTWQHLAPPPHHLIAAVPYKYNQTQLASGWGDPSNIVQSPHDGYFYFAMWNRNQVGLQAPGLCMVRSATLMDPSSWRGWDGSSFTVPFVSPYTLPPGSEAQHICQVLDNMPGRPGACVAGGLAWSAYLELFVMTLDCADGTFVMTTSEDLVHWTTAVPLYSQSQLPANVSHMTASWVYPTFMDPTAHTAFGDRNFGTIGANPALFWVSIGHSPYSDGRHLWATPMLFEK